MRQIKLLTLLAGLILFGCDKGNNATPEPAKSITISADKTEFVADGNDVVTFKVVLQDGANVTDKCSFVVNGKEQAGNTFSTQEAGTYKISAKYEKLTSTEISITATAAPIRDIVLTADKKTIITDGKDAVTFKVALKDGKDVTDECTFDINGKEQKQKTFATTVAGKYKVVAKYNKAVSSAITITAEEESQYFLKSDKKEILQDGHDQAELSLTDYIGLNYTASAKFFCNGNAMASNIFKETKPGSYTITAKVDNRNAGEAIVIKVTNDVKFMDRVLAENFTATWCGYCPPVKEKLKEYASKNKQIIVVSLQLDDELTGDSRKAVENLKKYFNITGIPAVIIDRKSKWNNSDPASYLEPESFVGIAMETKINGKQVTVKPILKSKQAFSGKIVIGITENGISANQNGYNGVMEHNFVLKNYYPSEFGTALKLEKDKTIIMNEQTFTLPDKCNVENCNVVIIIAKDDNKVVTAQQVRAGENVGY